MTTDEVIASLERLIQRKEREIAYTKKWILKLREPTPSIKCGWRRDGIFHCFLLVLAFTDLFCRFGHLFVIVAVKNALIHSIHIARNVMQR
jgi:hypothetical protein